MTSIHKRWVERVSGEIIKHSHVIQLYNTVYPMHRGYRVGGKATNLTKREASQIIVRIQMSADKGVGLRAEPEKEKLGRLWLANMEKPRNLPALPWHSIERFTLVGFHVYDEREFISWGKREVIASVAPIWRCHFPDGSLFDYSPTAWQSGTDKPMWWTQKAKVTA